MDDEGNLIENAIEKEIAAGQAVLDERERQNALKEQQEQEHQDRMFEAEQWRQAKIEELEKNSAQTRKDLALTLYDDLLAMTNSFFGSSAEEQKKAFEFNKAVQQAENAVTTYLAATKAYASQLIPGDPSSVVRAQIAAGMALPSGS